MEVLPSWQELLLRQNQLQERLQEQKKRFISNNSSPVNSPAPSIDVKKYETKIAKLKSELSETSNKTFLGYLTM